MKLQKLLSRFGPAIITACLVLGPGSLLVSANIGAKYGCQLLWMLAGTGLLMGTYVTMAARIGTVGGATPCTLIASRLGRIPAAVIGINLCLVCAVFQFANNLAFATAIKTLVPALNTTWILLLLNAVIIVFLFAAKKIYHILEQTMKVVVGLMLACFLLNLVIARPNITAIIKGLIPSIPPDLSLKLPQKIDGSIKDPLILIASLLGTTFSVGGAFYMGNLVREKGWTQKDYRRGIGDSIVGVSVLTVISAIIMITTATVIPGKPASNIGTLAQSLGPLLGSLAHVTFCVGLLAVAMNPFLINAMIGGGILADGLGKGGKLSDTWPKRFTVLVLLAGMFVAMLILHTPIEKIDAIIFGQALTVICNPLLAASLLWLANRKDIMGKHKNKTIMNIFAGFGFLVVLFMAFRVLYRIILQLI